MENGIKSPAVTAFCRRFLQFRRHSRDFFPPLHSYRPSTLAFRAASRCYNFLFLTRPNFCD
jgi:hypothetical protein